MENTANQIHLARKYKFLRRKLEANQFSGPKFMTMARLKRVHFKLISHEDSKELLRTGLGRKQSSCLSTLEMGVKDMYYTMNTITSCRVLKKIQVSVMDELPTREIINIIKRLPKRLESFEISGWKYNVQTSDLRCLYRALAGFPNLRLLNMSVELLNDNKYLTEKETALMNRYLPRLRNLKLFQIERTENNQMGFQKIMEKDQGCPYVTNLSLKISWAGFGSREDDMEFLDEEQSDDDEKESKDKSHHDDADVQAESEGEVEGEDDDQDEDDQDEEADDVSAGEDDVMAVEDQDEDDSHNNSEEEGEKEQDRDRKTQMAPYFKFHLFQNLQKLSLYIGGDYPYPVDSFVVEGFKSLQKLERLSLILCSRPNGTKYFFDGLMHLPLLTSFSLDITFIRDNEYSLLTHFLKQQSKLVSLSLCISSISSSKERYRAQNLFLENSCEFLNNKPQLKYLTLKAEHWTLESLSRGLEKTVLLSQLESFKIEVFDDSVTSSSSVEDRVKGLCKFLVRQKATLHTLTINLSYVFDDAIINNISTALMHLDELKALEFNLSETEEHKESEEFTIPSEWHSNLPNIVSHFAKAFKKLHKLTDLTVQMDGLKKPENDIAIDFFALLKAASTINGLQTLQLRFPLLVDTLERNPNQDSILLELPRLTSRYLESVDDDDMFQTKVFSGGKDEINQRVKCSLMF